MKEESSDIKVSEAKEEIRVGTGAVDGDAAAADRVKSEESKPIPGLSSLHPKKKSNKKKRFEDLFEIATLAMPVTSGSGSGGWGNSCGQRRPKRRS